MSKEIEDELTIKIDNLTEVFIKPFLIQTKNHVFNSIQKINKEYRLHRSDLFKWVTIETYLIMEKVQTEYQSVYEEILKNCGNNFLMKEWLIFFIHRTKNQINESLINFKSLFLHVIKAESGTLKYHFPDISLEDMKWRSANMKLEITDINENIKTFFFEYPKGSKENYIYDTKLSAEPLYVSHIPKFTFETLFELFKNAEHSLNGSGTISIKTNKSSSSIHLIVSDTGRGIPANQLPKVFSQGFTTRREGTGSGLALVQVYVERILKGEIEIKSIEGKGTEVIIKLQENKSPENS